MGEGDGVYFECRAAAAKPRQTGKPGTRSIIRHPNDCIVIICKAGGGLFGAVCTVASQGLCSFVHFSTRCTAQRPGMFGDGRGTLRRGCSRGAVKSGGAEDDGRRACVLTAAECALWCCVAGVAHSDVPYHPAPDGGSWPCVRTGTVHRRSSATHARISADVSGQGAGIAGSWGTTR